MQRTEGGWKIRANWTKYLSNHHDNEVEEATGHCVSQEYMEQGRLQTKRRTQSWKKITATNTNACEMNWKNRRDWMENETIRNGKEN